MEKRTDICDSGFGTARATERGTTMMEKELNTDKNESEDVTLEVGMDIEISIQEINEISRLIKSSMSQAEAYEKVFRYGVMIGKSHV